MTDHPAAPILEQLKDFQRATAEYAFGRMYADHDPAHRFLVADEVGLGKTLVAKGVIAKTIEHLDDTVERIDIVYVCSNTQIARQNVRRLGVAGLHHLEVADRITMLPVVARNLNENKVNIVSFTPGTSFDLKGGSGRYGERIILRLMLEKAWGTDSFQSKGSMRIFQGGVRKLASFEDAYRAERKKHWRHIDDDMVASFTRVLEEHDARAVASATWTLRQRFDDLCQRFYRERPRDKWGKDGPIRNKWVGEIRDLLARSCFDALQPDLVILDEFQRFKHLLKDPNMHEDNPAAELASQLFSYVDADTNNRARVLLLSATPYKMMTVAGEADDNHYDDLIDTADFLFEHDQDKVDDLRSSLADLRRGLLQVGRDSGAAARTARTRVETIFREVMVRTERLAATDDRSGMLTTKPCEGLRLDTADVGSFVAGARLARALGAPDPLEYWKSAPFLPSYMDGYKAGQALADAIDDDTPGLNELLDTRELVPFEAIRKFKRINFPNPRLRWLIDETVGNGAWRLLWVPPSLPYLSPTGAFADPKLRSFTKRLLFSSWRMVPTAASTLITYEAERRMVTARGRAAYDNTAEGRQGRGRLLDFAYTANRLTGMPVLGIMFPSVALAQDGDPLQLTQDNNGDPIAPDDAIRIVATRIQQRLDQVLADIRSEGSEVPTDGRPDETWYWAAPMWFDWFAEEQGTEELLGSARALAGNFTGSDRGEGDRFRDHIDHARKTYIDYPADLGKMPDDLAEVLARVAIAGPGPCAVRALARATTRPVEDLEVRRGAARLAWGVRALFNTPEATELVRHEHPGDPYWQRLIDYSLAGNLQSVLDEYAAVLLPSRGYLDANRHSDGVAADLAEAMHNTLTLRTVNYAVRNIKAGLNGVTTEPGRLRANFAVRLTDDRTSDDAGLRPEEVREAFNSPFRPFVLATTSAGQEGLDFHTYCHAVIHWNLPANPVDLEQREGRVHRYMGHAVRRNIATVHGAVGRSQTNDPWAQMWSAAADDETRPDGQTEIVPYWVYRADGGSQIERYVPALPLSRDASRAAALQRSVALYRLAFGQPRQEDLIAYLDGQIDPDLLTRILDDLRIDLSPR